MAVLVGRFSLRSLSIFGAFGLLVWYFCQTGAYCMRISRKADHNNTCNS